MGARPRARDLPHGDLRRRSPLFSAAWGQAAARIGVDHALLAAAIGALVAHPAELAMEAARRRRDRSHAVPPLPASAVGGGDGRRPRPGAGEDRVPDRPQGSRPASCGRSTSSASSAVATARFAWGVFEDMAEFGRFEEAYLIESWLELMHFRERVTIEDRADRGRDPRHADGTAAHRIPRRRRAASRVRRGQDAPAGA